MSWTRRKGREQQHSLSVEDRNKKRGLAEEREREREGKGGAEEATGVCSGDSLLARAAPHSMRGARPPARLPG